MRYLIAALVLGALLVGCGASAPAEPAWLASTCGQPPLVEHPSVLTFSCDGAVAFKNAHWSGWGQQTATGTGTAYLEGNCIPDCASAPVYTYSVRLVASQIALCGSAGHTRRVYGLVVANFSRPDFKGQRTLSERLLSCV